MPKIKLTKGELKRQRDALRQYERYLPTLQLKKQQLQMEILHQTGAFNQKTEQEKTKRSAIEAWAGLLDDPGISIPEWIKLKSTQTDLKNIAGIQLPVFRGTEFSEAEYDLFLAPLWVDAGIEALKELVSIRQELRVLEKGIEILKHELRITTQRVNLFEKIKIPQAQEAIRLIKIYIGDQMTNAVGRSKMAKRKIEELLMQEVAA